MSFVAGNLDACAAQMASWQPFAGRRAVMVEEKTHVGAVGEGFVCPLAVGSQNLARCNSAVTMFTQGGGNGDESRHGVQLSGRSVSCPSLNVNSGEAASVNTIADNLASLSNRIDVFAASTGRHTGTEICPPSRPTLWEEPSSASLAKCHSLPAVQETRWDIFSNTMCAFTSSRQGFMHEGRKRVGRWSRRKKQMSHAFLRSLWRWKEGVHARKRRKRAVVGSCSGSGARSYTSDPPGVGGASTNPRSVIGTDSSGELFFGVVGNQTNWGADFIKSTASSESGFCIGNTELRDAGADHFLPFWLSAHSDGGLTTESGYNSEPGYSADSELNCTDDGFVDDDEEDEKQPMHLVVWKDSTPRKPFHPLDKGQVLEECVVELFYGKNHRMRRLQPRLRHTRRLWRQSELFRSRCRRSNFLKGPCPMLL